MSLLSGAIMGLIQGLSEFLPISSSGHLNLVQALFGLELDYQLFFNILLHVGTLIAVLVVFWKDWLDMLLHPIKNKTLLLLFIASLPALVVKIIFGDVLTYIESSHILLGVCFIVTGVFLIITQNICKKQQEQHSDLKTVGAKNALIMGSLQAIGMLPGISRSGSTIFAGVLSGLNREVAAKFSFMMSAPAIVAGALSEGVTVMKEGVVLGGDLPAIILGMVVAAISGYISIRFFMKLISKASLRGFAIYMLCIGCFTLVLCGIGKI